MSRRSLLAAVGPICALLVLAALPSDAFTAIQPAAHTTVSTTGASTTTSLYLGNFGKKKEPQEDLSYIETRDMIPPDGYPALAHGGLSNASSIDARTCPPAAGPIPDTVSTTQWRNKRRAGARRHAAKSSSLSFRNYVGNATAPRHIIEQYKQVRGENNASVKPFLPTPSLIACYPGRFIILFGTALIL